MTVLIAWAWPYLLAGGIALAGAWRLWRSGKRAGRDAERAANARQREEHLERIKRAADACPAGELQDDPFNRDNT
jgi:hypothetical protein